MMKKGLMALSPLLLFIVLYLVTSIVAHDFYKVPITVAFLIAAVCAVAMPAYGDGHKLSLRQRVDVFSRGAGSSQMLLMVWIFVLAGAFANTARAMGAVDATVNLTLAVLPAEMILAGLFVAACFISLSIGTSVGTIVALMPIAAGIAHQTGASTPLMAAVIVGGSFFGDNLSFISDTTIIATQTQGCRLSDKFRVNAFIVVPAAAVVLVVYFIMGHGIASPTETGQIAVLKVLPYLLVLAMAIVGVNVMTVLVLGIGLTGAIGLADGAFADLYDWFKALSGGIVGDPNDPQVNGMGELIIVTMLAGGLLEVIKHNGGIAFIIDRLTRRISGKRGAELSIGALVGLVNICTANNTVSIITVGSIANEIGQRFGLDPRKCASLLDTFSCAVQGLIPYGAQLLMAAGLAAINPIDILPYLYYPVAIGLAATVSILIRYPKRYS